MIKDDEKFSETEKDNAADTELRKTAEAAEAEKITAANGLGKFASVGALLTAYKSLEAEFTRRSQRLKELEEGNKARLAFADASSPENTNGNGNTGAPAADGEVAADGELSASGETAAAATIYADKGGSADIKDGGGAVAEKCAVAAYAETDYAETGVPRLDESVKNAVIEEYLKSVASGKSVPLIVGGVGSAAPKFAPKTVKEAGALAQAFLKN